MKWRSLEESSPGLDTRSLHELFAARKDLIAKYVPAEAQAIHAQAIAELKSKKVAANILAVGAKAPHFESPVTTTNSFLLPICFLADASSSASSADAGVLSVSARWKR
jgi:hypothetical protein